MFTSLFTFMLDDAMQQLILILLIKGCSQYGSLLLLSIGYQYVEML